LPEQPGETKAAVEPRERAGPDPALLRVDEAARYLALGRTKTYELVAQGVIPSIRLGRVVRIPREALRAWIEREVRGDTAAPPAPAASRMREVPGRRAVEAEAER
jgi:excisionase family DNA binding protein